MTETSGREKVLETARCLFEADEAGANKVLRMNRSWEQLYWHHRERYYKLARALIDSGVVAAALASPSTPEPALRGGKVEEIAERVEISAKRWTLCLERDDWKPSRAHIESARDILNEAAAALRTYAGESAAQSERAGLERAAEWHDEQRSLADSLGKHIEANIYRNAAEALRALATGGRDDAS